MTKKRKFSEGLLNDDIILDELPVYHGQTILDAGCGNGYMSEKFADHVGEKGIVYAVDKEELSIKNLKKENDKNNLIFMVADITTTTQFADCFFDLVYLSTVLHIFSADQVERFIKETKRILKPGGTLAIVTFKKVDTPFGPPVESKESPEELRRTIDLIPKKCVEAGTYFYMQLFTNS